MFAPKINILSCTTVLIATVLVGCSSKSQPPESMQIPSVWKNKIQPMPAKTWEGGKSNLKIHVESSQAALIKMEFDEDTPDDKQERKIVVEQPIGAGRSDFVVNIKPRTGGYFEVGIPEAKPGATLNCSLSLDDKVIWKESSQLNGVLGANEAFFLNVDFNDFTSGERSSDD